MANREEELRYKFPFRNGLGLLLAELVLFDGLVLKYVFPKV
ncbi:MAG: hypothetical protein ACJAZC_001440 [Cryomorphaceae bacterium]|jgi:hypothetical protein